MVKFDAKRLSDDRFALIEQETGKALYSEPAEFVSRIAAVLIRANEQEMKLLRTRERLNS